MIQIKTNSDGTFDLFNNEFNARITNESFSSVKEDNNYFITEKNEKFGVVSKSGVIYLNCEFQSILVSYNSDFIIYEKDNLFGILNTCGKSLNPICSSVFEVEHLIDDGSTSFIIEILYDYTMWNSLSGMHKELFLSLSYIGNGLIEFRKGNNRSREDRINQLVGLLDTTGNVLFEKKLTRIYSFPEINRIIIDEEDCYIIDYQLKQISSGFSEIFGFYGGASIAVKNDQCGLIDIQGDWIKGYENLDYEQNENWWAYYNSPYENGFVPIKKNGFYGLVCFDKQLFLDPISINIILFFNGGFGLIKLKNGSCGIIDKDLNWVLEPTLKDLYFPFEGLIDIEEYYTTTGFPYIYQSHDNLKFGLMRCNGNIITKAIYDKIYTNDYDIVPNSYLFYLKFDQDGKKGVVNIKGEEIFKGVFDWDSNSNFDPFLYDNTDFQIELNKNYLDSAIPEDNIFFPVIKDNEVGYHDANGTFFLGNPIILND